MSPGVRRTLTVGGIAAFAAALAYVFFVRGSDRVPEVAGSGSTDKPPPPKSAGGLVLPSPDGAGAPAGIPGTDLPAMTPMEQLDFHAHIDHTECEEGAKKVNQLRGLAPTDPKGITTLTVCLRVGNLAWYKCILRAQDADAAQLCTRRFLSLDNPP